MSVADTQVDKFIDYLEYYPGSDEEGYDGIHDGGWKGLSPDAPEEAKKQYAEFMEEKRRCAQSGAKM